MQFFAKLSVAAAFASSISALAVPTNGTLLTRAAAQVVTKCTVPNTVALTFDDGPYSYIYDISNALTAAGAKGTFFFNGNNYGCIYSTENQKRVKYAYNKGHQIASHTWGHKDLSTLTWDQVHDEMWRVEQALQRIAGVVPAFMRPPYGNYNDNVRNVAGARGQKLRVAIWDFDSEDSVGATPAQSKASYDQVIARHPSTILALNHETYERTAHEVIPYVIPKLQAAGYKLVTLAECLGQQPYQSVGSPQTPDFFAKLSVAAVFASSIIGALAAPTNTTLLTRAAAQVITSCTVPNTVALTFDDGPYSYIYDISKALVAAGAKGTFFFNGNNYGCIYDADNQKRVKYAYDKGHQIGSHTWAHEDLSTLTWDQVHDEMWRVEQALQRIIGVTPAFMRPPYGSYNDNVRNVAGVRGQKLAIWDFDSQDSIGATPAESKKLYDQVIGQRPSTILALNHETYERTAHEVIPYVIPKLQAAGYKLVTLAECLGQQPYQSVGSPQTPDGSWTC
ncbi:unnamed protein product [Rhizoctonia solani]|uniref:NodB homology domain-containing protein n=1 Tax=Rhizoctonia solani TaxID=456999 RepID=A0A8H3A3U6_9AGAM|nr:unnamed protein product [Rhizoctonia solani]